MSSLPTEFGPRLRALRMAKDISLSEFARRLYYSKGHVSRIETGVQTPSLEFVRRCDALLGANGSLIAMRQETHHDDHATSSPSPAGEEVWMVTMEPHGGNSFTPIARRDLLVGSTAILAGLRVPAAKTAPVHNGWEQLTHHRQLFDSARALGQIASPAAVIPMLIGQAQALRALANNARSDITTESAMLAARTAEFAGWMAQEAGDIEAALWWTGKAVQISAEAGDPHFGNYALVRRALITMYQGDAATTIALAQQAQTGRGTPRRILGLAAQREAQGHALAGDYDSCMRALDKARLHLDHGSADQPDGPVIGTTYVVDPVAMATGWCLLDLGRPAEAAAALDRELARIPVTAVRARARFEARRALACAISGELDRACTLAKPILQQAATVDSATVLVDIRRLAATLRRWSSHPAVRALEPALTAALCRDI